MNPIKIITDGDGNGETDFYLKSGETAVISGLPNEAAYSVTEEESAGYVTAIEANGSVVSDISDRKVQTEEVVFTNLSQGVLPTGIADHMAEIALACAAIILVTSLAVVILKRKRKLK